MKITVDTNILIRAAVKDDRRQYQAAAKILKDAELIAVTLPCLCEFVWVLSRVYKLGQKDIAEALNALLDANNVVVNRPAVAAGLIAFNAGADFADGLIAYEGNWMGGQTFVSFDKRAVSLLAQHGFQTKQLPS